MRDWLRGGMAAARVAASRAELWVPGAIVSFAFAGWVAFLLVVGTPPDESDVVYFGVRLAASPWWPWNLVALVMAALSGIGTMLLAIAFGEVALLMGLSDREWDRILITVPRAMAALGVAGCGVALVIAVLMWLAAPIFFEAYTQPDPSTPYAIRVAVGAWPALVVLAAVAAVAQAFGALALRHPWRVALSTLRRRAHRLLPQAALTTAGFLGSQVLTVLLLGSVWEPLSERLADGRLAEPATPILLLGFVWIWLVLVLLAGVVQAWISAWWSWELSPQPER
ncbi:MAG: hypothetical protein ACRDFZ_01415 [Candidatus Limnocylindria bacterium]